MNTKKERPSLRKLFSFDGVVERIKADPNLSRDQAMGDAVIEQVEAGKSAKSLNRLLAGAAKKTADARIASEEAAQMRAEGAAIQRQWDSLCETYDRTSSAIDTARAVHAELETMGSGALDEILRASFDWGGDREKSKGVAVQVAQAQLAAPVVAKAIARMRAELLEHAKQLREFAAEHELPPECLVNLVDG